MLNEEPNSFTYSRRDNVRCKTEKYRAIALASNKFVFFIIINVIFTHWNSPAVQLICLSLKAIENPLNMAVDTKLV